MVYEWSFGDGTKKRGLEVKHCFETPGNYLVQLNIIEKASGNLFYNELSYDFLIEEPKRLFIDCADTLSVMKEVVLDIKKSTLLNHTIKAVYWFFGDGKFAEGASVKHTYAKEGSYNIKLGVVAINDSTKKPEKFCTLRTILIMDSLWVDRQKKNVISAASKIDSLNYAFAADSLWQTKYKPYFDYTPSGIDSLNYMNELDSLWIANHKHDFKFIPSNLDMLYNIRESDSTDFRIYLGSSAKNIPVTAKVFDQLNNVKKYKEKDGYSYTSGNFKKLKNAIPDYEKAKAKGFKSAAVVGFRGDSLIAGQENSLKGVITGANKMSGDNELKSLHRKNILFDFDKAVINKSYYKYLDSLTNVLQKNKKLELIILAAADSVGSIAYNIKLAKNRANAVRQYFLERGIKEERLDINTFGENMPTEYTGDKISVISNRRVEILLVKKL
jgi:outer membrane protein OmpA-like peptidoglycan-associated protein